MQERVYRTPITDVDNLKQHLIDIWSGMQQSVIDKAVDQWHEQVKASVKASGRHFEYIL